VGNDVAAAYGVIAHELRHGRVASGLNVDKMPQAFVMSALEEGNPPAVFVLIGAAAALRKAGETKTHVGR